MFYNLIEFWLLIISHHVRNLIYITLFDAICTAHKVYFRNNRNLYDATLCLKALFSFRGTKNQALSPYTELDTNALCICGCGMKRKTLFSLIQRAHTH